MPYGGLGVGSLVWVARMRFPGVWTACHIGILPSPSNRTRIPVQMPIVRYESQSESARAVLHPDKQIEQKARVVRMAHQILPRVTPAARGLVKARGRR